MVEVLGDMLEVMPDIVDGNTLPSPESLRGKVIIKGKVVRGGEVGFDEGWVRGTDDGVGVILYPRCPEVLSRLSCKYGGFYCSMREVEGVSNEQKQSSRDLI